MITTKPKQIRELPGPSKSPIRTREEKSPNQQWSYFKEIQAKLDRPVR